MMHYRKSEEIDVGFGRIASNRELIGVLFTGKAAAGSMEWDIQNFFAPT